MLEETSNEDTRNVQDFMKFMPLANIRAKVQKEANPFGVLLANIEKDINVGGIIRTANNFNARQVLYYGRKKYNRVGAMGTYLYMDVRYCPDFETVLKEAEGYTWIGFEQRPDAIPLSELTWPSSPLIVLGHEGSGFDLVPEVADRVEQWVQIPTLGTVRSLNVAAVGAIAMFDFITKTGQDKPQDTRP